MSIKTKQLESNIHQILSELIIELDNSVAHEATITEVTLNNDHSVAKVYVSFIKSNDEDAYFELRKSVSHLRKELAKNIQLRKVPFIELVLDDNLERINHMEELINKVNKK